MKNAIIRDEISNRYYEVEERKLEKRIEDFNKTLIAKIEDENSPNEWFNNFKQELDEWHKNTFNEDPLPYLFYDLMNEEPVMETRPDFYIDFKPLFENLNELKEK